MKIPRTILTTLYSANNVPLRHNLKRKIVHSCHCRRLVDCDNSARLKGSLRNLSRSIFDPSTTKTVIVVDARLRSCASFRAMPSSNEISPRRLHETAIFHIPRPLRLNIRGSVNYFSVDALGGAPPPPRPPLYPFSAGRSAGSSSSEVAFQFPAYKDEGRLASAEV